MNDRSRMRRLTVAGTLLSLFVSLSSLGRAQEDPSDPLWFEIHMAPILARHCLECHDSGVRKGKLDLSDPEKVFAAKGGKAIVPGDAESSLVWESILLGEMPKERPLLNETQKELLRKWIDAGAVWSGGVIDAMAQTYDPQTAVIRTALKEHLQRNRRTVRLALADLRSIRSFGRCNTRTGFLQGWCRRCWRAGFSGATA